MNKWKVIFLLACMIAVIAAQLFACDDDDDDDDADDDTFFADDDAIADDDATDDDAADDDAADDDTAAGWEILFEDDFEGFDNWGGSNNEIVDPDCTGLESHTLGNCNPHVTDEIYWGYGGTPRRTINLDLSDYSEVRLEFDGYAQFDFSGSNTDWFTIDYLGYGVACYNYPEEEDWEEVYYLEDVESDYGESLVFITDHYQHNLSHYAGTVVHDLALNLFYHLSTSADHAYIFMVIDNVVIKAR